MNKIVFGVVLAVASILSGCTYLFNYGKIEIVSSTSGTQKAVDSKYYCGTTPDLANIAASGMFFSVRQKPGIFTDSTFKIRNKKTTPAFITETKEGYLPQTTYIPTTKTNTAKLFSWLPFALMPLILTWEEPFMQIGAYSYLYTVCYGLGELVFGANRIYPYKTIVLPPLKPIPQKKADENFIVVDSVIVSCKTDIIDVDRKTRFYKYFDSTYTFKKNYQHSTQIKRKELQYNLFETADSMMVKFGYTDTSSALFSSDEYNTNLLKIKVKDIKGKIPRFKGGWIADITIEFTLINMLGSDTLLTKEFTYGAIFPTSDYGFKKSIKKSFRESLTEFLAMEDVKEAIKSRDAAVQSTVESWDTLHLTGSEFCASPKEAVKSVVTVINGKSHGSACCIASGGYFITASHVVNGNENNIYILAPDGRKIKCQVLRSNLKHDLALLKADEIIEIKPIRIASENKGKTGSDVYAIGTPFDAELGQSISKGIISGKRNISDVLTLQTDVSVSPGHSGGALVNDEGELVGIICSKIFGSSIEGIAFGMPAKYIQSELKLDIK